MINRKATMTFCLLFLLVLASVPTRAALPQLVKDINTTSTAIRESNPSSFVDMNGVTYFVSWDWQRGAALWRSDGTPEETRVVKSFTPDFTGLNRDLPIRNLTVVGGTMFFHAYDRVEGWQLWRSDGTTHGTVPVMALQPYPDVGFEIKALSFMGNIAYFEVETHFLSGGVELWRTDGTEAGTYLVKHIHPGTINVHLSQFVVLGSTLFFVAGNYENEHGLWKTDGTESGTVLVKDINPTGRDSISGLTVINDTLYFSADDGVNGRELWRSDGTEAGTMLVKDVNPDGSSAPRSFTAIGNALFFVVYNGLSGYELWKTDGTASGTVLVKDINPTGVGNIGSLVAINDAIYFSADDGVVGQELWKTDGTALGTVLIKDINPEANSSPHQFTVLNDTLYFVADDGEHGLELWRSDGTGVGTVLVEDINLAGSAAVISLTAVNDALFFGANDGVHGRELWQSDGTGQGTALLANMNPDMVDSYPAGFTLVDNVVYFSADDGQHGRELWRTDGTVGGTFLVKDIRPNRGTPFSNMTDGGGVLYFGVFSQLWRSDGTESGTIRVAEGQSFSYVDDFIMMGDIIFFGAVNGVVGYELWRSDGTEAGTWLVKDISPGAYSSRPENFTVVGDTLYFTADDGVNGVKLWKTDGTEAGTVMVSDVTPYTNTGFGVMDNVLYFNARDGLSGYGFWKTDGSESGTVLVKDGNAGVSPSIAYNFSVVGDSLYFSAFDGVNGVELWKTDGTEVGTVLVEDINLGGSSNPSNLTEVGNALFFTADDGVNGRELWRSDGDGAQMVTNISSGSPFGEFESFVAVGDLLYFIDVSNDFGREIWVSDGTEAGTVLAADVYPGPFSSNPRYLIEYNNSLLFAAEDDLAGRELWQLPLNQPPEIIAVAGPPEPGPLGSVSTLVAEFSDDNDEFTLSVNWGDGNISEVTGSDTSLTIDHVYSAAGVYSAEVTVTDSGGESDSQTYQYIVVYDPSAGFVTGGGQVYSPEGAYLPDPSLSGSASFGFVSKYNKGKTVPSGNTEFEFTTADMSFESLSYEWLVVAGTKGMFKGSGTINGMGNFGFMLFAIDSDVKGDDKFRIQIWDKENGDALVYDNELGSSIDDDPVTTITHGAIKVHSKAKK